MLSELSEIYGSTVHDLHTAVLHTAVLMRENGINRICTRDTDFYSFPFMEAIDPLR